MATLETTTVDRVKISSLSDLDLNDTTKDELLYNLILEVSTQIEEYLGHELIAKQRVEVFDVEPLQERMWLPQWPVSSIDEVRNRSSAAVLWADTSALDTTSYTLLPNPGRIEFNTTLLPGPLNLQVTYTAGIAATTQALIASNADLVAAAERQVGYLFRRRENPDRTSTSFQGASFTGTIVEARLLPSVKETLRKYKRPMLF